MPSGAISSDSINTTFEKQDSEAVQKLKRASEKAKGNKAAKLFTRKRGLGGPTKPVDNLKSGNGYEKHKHKIAKSYDDNDNDSLSKRQKVIPEETPEQVRERENDSLLLDFRDNQQIAKAKQKREELEKQVEELEKQDRIFIQEAIEEKKLGSDSQRFIPDRDLSMEDIRQLAIDHDYPTEIDQDNFEKRATQLCREIAENIISGKTESPFYDKLKQYSIKRSDTLRIWISSLIEDNMLSGAGYYGPKGTFSIGLILDKILPASMIIRQYDVPECKWMTKFEVQTITRAIVCPHIATKLIMEDKGCEFEKALKILEESYIYGTKMFPDNDNQKSLIEEETRRKESGDVVYAMDEGSSGQSDNDSDFS